MASPFDLGKQWDPLRGPLPTALSSALKSLEDCPVGNSVLQAGRYE
jgi:hypothetical protein